MTDATGRVPRTRDDLLSVGFDIQSQREAHIHERSVSEWREVDYRGTRQIVCFFCWHGLDAEPLTKVPLIAKGRHGGKVRPHFSHPAGTAVHDPRLTRETLWHLNGKLRLAQWAANQQMVATAVVEQWTPDRTRRADVSVTLRDGSRFALEVQRQAMTDHDWLRRHLDYVRQDIASIWFLRPNGPIPYVLVEAGAQVFTLDEDALGIALGRAHPIPTFSRFDRLDDAWWQGDLGLYGLHHPPCPADKIEWVWSELESVGLSAEGVTMPDVAAARIGRDRERVERAAQEQRDLADRVEKARERGRQQVAAQSTPRTVTARQQRIIELRSIRGTVPDRLPRSNPAAKAPPRPSSLVTPAFTVPVSCRWCNAEMGVLTTWPSFFGVPRATHPLICTECGRLSGDPCPCEDCT